MERQSKILILGAGGLIGGKIATQLQEQGFKQVIACTHFDLELTDQNAVRNFFQKIRPEYVFFCAVKAITDFSAGQVGDAEELEDNLLMVDYTMQACRDYGVKRAIFLGSAMLYPWNIEPMPEQYTEDMLEHFNLKGYSRSMESAVLSKLLTYKLCHYYRRQYSCDFLYCLPVHIYGGFMGRKNLYFIERLVMEICDAKLQNRPEVFLDVYGQGTARKSILHVVDCASALLAVMESYRGDSIAVNIASEETTCWREIVEAICKILDYQGKVYFNTEKRENTLSRICDVQKLNALGWKPYYTVESGLMSICQEYLTLRGHNES